jgi:hypothetical protein
LAKTLKKLRFLMTGNTLAMMSVIDGMRREAAQPRGRRRARRSGAETGIRPR